MAIKTVRAASEVLRRAGLGAQQCAACGWVYDIAELPVERCAGISCPTNGPAKRYEVWVEIVQLDDAVGEQDSWPKVVGTFDDLTTARQLVKRLVEATRE